MKNNAASLALAAVDPDFVGVRIDTGFIERHGDRLVPGTDPSDAIL